MVCSPLEVESSGFNELGWEIKEEANPGVYEREWKVTDPRVDHVLIFTDYNKSNYLVTSSHDVINAYIRTTLDGSCDVELRYMSFSMVSFKKFYNYENDKLIEKIYTRIEEALQSN